MAVSMWRMNGLWRRMAAVVVLCTVLLSNEVICEDSTTVNPPTGSPANPATDAAASPVTSGPATGVPITRDTAASTTGGFTTSVTSASTLGIDTIPEVKCVGKEDIPESNAVKVTVDTSDCETTKNIILENAAAWCPSKHCNLNIFQDGNTVLLASGNVKLRTLAEALMSENVKEKLGTPEIPSTTGSSVFAGILVTGLLAALAITIGYFKCHRKSDSKEVRLAEEGYPVDQENQGNTLASVTPLIPPPETQEKPSANGESPEAAKTEPPPPNNGHSTAKTADTEL